MSNFGLSAGTRYVTLEQADKLGYEFDKFITSANEMIYGAVRHSISNTINKVRDATKSFIASSSFNSSSPVRRQKVSDGGAPLIEGVRAYMSKGNNVGFVHILGNRGTNDGTWMLRFFEGGSVDRVNKSGKINSKGEVQSYGHLTGYHFFDRATSNIDTMFYEETQRNINKTVAEING